jgi:diaminohydroxyphosphoribosylaminopyrimidine deaminase/5-amino-6-(5-phosphoribosylamino)uracil reductase
MREAISLSRNGFPAPNPHVGCVIVRDGLVVGRGFHDYAGGPHAEAVAITDAGEAAEGADVYVTLEPCNHTGRTPPCAQALIRARVKRVFIACLDPNPRAAGGIQSLSETGINVRVGLLAEEAIAANRQFMSAVQMGRPVVTLKSAVSLDSKIALVSGESKWITGPEARLAAHRLRAESGSVLVGYKTVMQDDPELTARVPGVVNQPVRIVVDPHCALRGGERVFNNAAPTIHITTPQIDLKSLLESLYGRGINGVLVEGGAGTIRRFVETGLVDRLELFVAPILMGEGLNWTEGLTFPTLAETPRLQIESVERLGSDIQISATFLKMF